MNKMANSIEACVNFQLILHVVPGFLLTFRCRFQGVRNEIFIYVTAVQCDHRSGLLLGGRARIVRGQKICMEKNERAGKMLIDFILH